MEWRLFPEGTVPEYTTPQWYAGRERAPHLEQPGHRERLLLTFDMLKWVVDRYPARHTVSDLGCGDGGLLSLVSGMPYAGSDQLAVQAGVVSAWGYDISPEAVKGAHDRGVIAYVHDVVADPQGVEWGNISVATEMLEHLVDPHAFVRKIRENSWYVVASSPFNENDRGHYEFHTWAWDMTGYRKLFEDNGWSVISHGTVQSFQVLVAEAANEVAG